LKLPGVEESTSSEVSQDRLKELLEDAWRLVAPPRIHKRCESDL